MKPYYKEWAGSAITNHLDFLRFAGFDLAPDKRNIRHLIDSGWTTTAVAEVYGVSVRTIQRFLADNQPCPGERCLTRTPGGRLCHFCRRTAELAR